MIVGTKISVRKFVALNLAIHLLAIVVLFGVDLAFGAISPIGALIVASVLFSTNGTAIAVAVFTITRSESKAVKAATIVSCRRAGYLYGTFAGGILGAHFWGTQGAIAVAAASFILGWYSGTRLGRFLWARIALIPAPVT
jgi:hypothetical protein